MNKASSPNRKKNDKGINIAIAVIAVLAVIAVIFVMLRGCDDSGSAKIPLPHRASHMIQLSKAAGTN